MNHLINDLADEFYLFTYVFGKELDRTKEIVIERTKIIMRFGINLL